MTRKFACLFCCLSVVTVLAARTAVKPIRTQAPPGAGVGTAPATTQSSATTATSPGTKATFSVATRMIGSIAGVFKVGVLVGVDTQGKNSGFQYQGKPWIGISLGAGTQ